MRCRSGHVIPQNLRERRVSPPRQPRQQRWCPIRRGCARQGTRRAFQSRSALPFQRAAGLLFDRTSKPWRRGDLSLFLSLSLLLPPSPSPSSSLSLSLSLPLPLPLPLPLSLALSPSLGESGVEKREGKMRRRESWGWGRRSRRYPIGVAALKRRWHM